MKLDKGKGRIKSLDADTDGSCSRSSKVELTDILLQKAFSRANRRKKNQKSQRCSARTRVKTCLVSEQRFYSSAHGERRGGSGRGHTEKAAATGCGRILCVVQHLLNSITVHLPRHC